MSQHVQPQDLRLTPRSQGGSREPVPQSCILAHIYSSPHIPIYITHTQTHKRGHTHANTKKIKTI